MRALAAAVPVDTDTARVDIDDLQLGPAVAIEPGAYVVTHVVSAALNRPQILYENDSYSHNGLDHVRNLVVLNGRS